MSIQSLPDIFGLIMMIVVLIRLRGLRKDHSVDVWTLGLGCILLEAIAVAIYRGGMVQLHALAHVVALDCYVCASVAFGCAAGRPSLPNSRPLVLFALPAIPLFLLASIYGMGIAVTLPYTTICVLSLLFGTGLLLVQFRAQKRLLFLLLAWHLAEWGSMLWLACAGQLRFVVYVGLACAYIRVSVAFRHRIRRDCVGGIIVVAAFAVLAVTLFVHPLTPPGAAWAPVVEQVWNLQKYFIILGMVIVLLEEERERRRAEAMHDSLTGLPNRRLLADRLQQAFARATRTRSSVGLYLIDLDGFKQINDSMGHLFGDQVLKTVAAQLNQIVRKSDTLARVGGDEFCVIVNDLPNEAAFEIVAASIRRSIQSVSVPGDAKLTLSGSVGFATFPVDGESAEELTEVADARMYVQKRFGSRELVTV